MSQVFINAPVATQEMQEVISETPASNDEAATKFKNDATACMQKICTAMKKLEDLAGKKGMVYTEEDIDKIFTYLSSKLEKSKSKFMDKIEEQKGFDFTF